MSGSTNVLSDNALASAAPFGSVIRMILPPRAATSCMFDTVFSKTPSRLALLSTGATPPTGLGLPTGRHRRPDEHDRPLLQLPRGITFGMDVGNFLELERALKRDGIGRASAEIKHVLGLGEIARQTLYLGLQPKRLRHVSRHLDHSANEITLVLRRQDAADTPGGDGEA